MTKEDKIAFKNRLKLICQSIIEQRIQSAKAVINNAQEAVNQEEKSSAGDKYETTRAMGHLEKDLHTRQLAENLKELAALHAIGTSTLYISVTAGAFIRCKKVSFFLAAGLGKQVVDGESILFLSPNTPLARVLEGKKANDNFVFNGKDMVIEDVF